MRRTLGALSALAVVCGVATIACLAIGEKLLERSRLFGTSELTQVDVETGQPIARSGSVLLSLAPPLAAAGLLAVIAILALLALRWEFVRR